MVECGEDRLDRARQDFRRFVLVQQYRADRIFAHRPNPVGQHQPALIDLDRASAIADLDEFPRIFGLHQQAALIPRQQIVGLDQEQVLTVLAAEHMIVPANLAREQRHALVDRGTALERDQVEFAKIACPQHLRANAAPGKSGVGAEIFGAAVVVRKLRQPQILEPVRLRRGDRKDHCSRKIAVLVAVNPHRSVGVEPVAIERGFGRRRERRFGRQRQAPARRDQPLAKGDRTDVTFADRAQRQHDPPGILVEPALVGVRDHAGVHQRRRRIAIFVTEIGADQRSGRTADLVAIKLEQRRDLIEAPMEHLLGLPVARLEIVEHVAQDALGRAFGQCEHVFDQLLRPTFVGALRLPREMERADDDARRIGFQPQCMREAVQHGRNSNVGMAARPVRWRGAPPS